ncbi:TIGR03668 family PPOX class F420-dependent oxidoreductase [Gryllotalpicola protaetiae]|uniref:TIGR03668 family PPOX class F420-dependent oxidoreductase n=1 Tax=Gryllotalpicola protaetiae TaxID=2419771 RepID=A0A387BTY5_9MICO|nr:TIGR03668 family PPOX class F420-dependent oxidoreductase [Gryllotalpicola protaetiae]AYG04479.1 TIGR03668 family PPOX class F420-dependent oxidoreductase [Gryllotalpicola protaetiae]
MKLSEADARARVASARVARLATVGRDGAPHLVPVVFAPEGELIYIAVDFKPKSSPNLRRLRNIAENPQVALLVDAYGDDWDELWWARVDGEATVLTDAGELRHPIDVLVARYPQYRARRPDGPVIAIRAQRWTGWSAA